MFNDIYIMNCLLETDFIELQLSLREQTLLKLMLKHLTDGRQLIPLCMSNVYVSNRDMLYCIVVSCNHSLKVTNLNLT